MTGLLCREMQTMSCSLPKYSLVDHPWQILAITWTSCYTINCTKRLLSTNVASEVDTSSLIWISTKPWVCSSGCVDCQDKQRYTIVRHNKKRISPSHWEKAMMAESSYTLGRGYLASVRWVQPYRRLVIFCLCWMAVETLRATLDVALSAWLPTSSSNFATWWKSKDCRCRLRNWVGLTGICLEMS